MREIGQIYYARSNTWNSINSQSGTSQAVTTPSCTIINATVPVKNLRSLYTRQLVNFAHCNKMIAWVIMYILEGGDAW